MKGHADGPFGVARFNSPQGLAYSSEKKCVFVCDTTNHVIRSIDLTKFQVSTIAGNGNQRLNSYQGIFLYFMKFFCNMKVFSKKNLFDRHAFYK